MADDVQIVVVGVDFGPRGDDAIAMALDYAHRSSGVVLHAVHALPPADLYVEPGQSMSEARERALTLGPMRVRRRINLVAASRGETLAAVRLVTHARSGDPASVLCQLAVDFQADMIIVGTQDRRGLSQLLHRSVAARLVREAPCPVVVARPRTTLEPMLAPSGGSGRAGEAPSMADGLRVGQRGKP